MDIIHETWITEKRLDESIISHVLTIKENMEIKMAEIVKTNLDIAQELQKKWHDKSVKERIFQEGEQLSSSSTSKLVNL